MFLAKPCSWDKQFIQSVSSTADRRGPSIPNSLGSLLLNLPDPSAKRILSLQKPQNRSIRTKKDKVTDPWSSFLSVAQDEPEVIATRLDPKGHGLVWSLGFGQTIWMFFLGNPVFLTKEKTPIWQTNRVGVLSVCVGSEKVSKVKSARMTNQLEYNSTSQLLAGCEMFIYIYRI